MSKAAVFTIGTEITDGQITDRNSQWISEHLTRYGVDVLLHASMPDDQEQIVAFLKNNTESFDFIILSGGLGPTSDDLTRFAVAEHVHLPLQLDDDSWESIQNKLKNKTVALRDGHKMQAMIPEGALALVNNVGIAPGIYLEFQNKHFFLLPGPPQELQAIWNDNVEPFFKKLNIQNNRKLKLWQCTGIPESEIAHLTETFFAPYAFVLKTGYRIHKPNVEVKIWYTESPDAEDVFFKFEKLIDKFIIK